MTTKLPLVLLPGLACDATVWQHQIQHLSDLADITVADLLHAHSLEQMINGVMQNAPEKFYLAGHSMGGWLGLQIALRYPNRIQKLCVISSSVDQDTSERTLLRKAAVEKAQNGKYLEVIPDIIKAFVYNHTIDAELTTMLSRHREGFILQQNILIPRQSFVDQLNSISIPVLVLQARQDNYFSTQHYQQILDNIPKAQGLIIEDSGHMLPMEQPQAVTAVLRHWLQY